jgi:hypothetical protein
MSYYDTFFYDVPVLVGIEVPDTEVTVLAIYSSFRA